MICNIWVIVVSGSCTVLFLCTGTYEDTGMEVHPPHFWTPICCHYQLIVEDCWQMLFFFLFCQCSMLPVVILGTMNDIISYIATYIHIYIYSYLYIYTYIYIYIHIYISDEFVKVQLFVMQSSAGRRVVCSARGGLSCVCYNGTLYPSNEGNPLVFWWIAVTLLWPGRGDFSASGLSTFKKIALTLALDCTIWDFTMSFSPLK